jgi:hypothetical protein
MTCNKGLLLQSVSVKVFFSCLFFFHPFIDGVGGHFSMVVPVVFYFVHLPSVSILFCWFFFFFHFPTTLCFSLHVVHVACVFCPGLGWMGLLLLADCMRHAESTCLRVCTINNRLLELLRSCCGHGISQSTRLLAVGQLMTPHLSLWDHVGTRVMDHVQLLLGCTASE